MNSNNFLLAFRHLTRQKLSTTLHIVGLTLGIGTCLMITLYLRYELSFDAYHPNSSSTYRINTHWVESGTSSFSPTTPMPLAEALRQEGTGMTHIALAHPVRRSTIEISHEKIFNENRALIVEPEFVDVFAVESVKGNPKEILAKPYHALLTESAAKRYFGDEDPVGKTFRLNDQFEITVGGIMRDFPSNTHLPASMLLSFVPNEQFTGHAMDGWSYVSGTETFVVLPKGSDVSGLERLLKSIADKHINASPNSPPFLKTYFDIQPLTNVHFDTNYSGGALWVQAVNPSWLWFFGLIGICVLILACINFMNLSTAQATQRAREVGVRKSIGAGRGSLILQFLTEAWVLTGIAAVLSLVLVRFALPFVNTLLAKNIALNLFSSPFVLGSLSCSVLVIGLFAGIYPSWIISRFNPAKTLKASNSFSGDKSSALLRKILVVAQFSISAGLVIALLLIAQQVSFLRNMNLGFEKENIITVRVGNNDKKEFFTNELLKIPHIQEVTYSTAAPSSRSHWSTSLSNKHDDQQQKKTTLILADENYFKTYRLKLKAGRTFVAADTNAVSKSIPKEQRIMKSVVNEKLIQAMGFDSNESAIGKEIWIGFTSGRVEITGVVADFNTGSLHKAIEPTLITQNSDLSSLAGISIEASGDIVQTIASIEKAWKQAHPKGVFEFTFLDDQIDAFYKIEERLFSLFKIFTAIAMLISCLGLWGLATFAAQQRTKEIGVRKVLGASVSRIIVMMSRDFVLPVLLAVVVSVPIVYFLMDEWLSQFAYHVSIGWEVFLVTGLILLITALLTVSFQALRAAIANPVIALKNE